MTEPGEPSRKRIKKEEDDGDQEVRDDGSTEEHDSRPIDPNSMMEDQKHQLAAFLSVLAQQSPLNPSVKQPSAGPSQLKFFLIQIRQHIF